MSEEKTLVLIFFFLWTLCSQLVEQQQTLAFVWQISLIEALIGIKHVSGILHLKFLVHKLI